MKWNLMSLKDRIKNLAGGDANKAQILLRVYMMERFLERLSRSRYRDNFVLKGGVLVSSLVGIEYRTTMDIDSTIRSLTLDQENAKRIIEEIARIPLEDGVSFEIQSEENIMEDSTIQAFALCSSGASGTCDSRSKSIYKPETQ